MASNLSLLRSFVDGQSAGALTYTAYATDLDFNFAAIEAQFNNLNAEFKAFGGQNAALVLDLTQTPTLTIGFVGANSFAPSFISGNTTLRVTRGEALTASGRVQVTTANTDLVGSGSSGTRWAALSATGVISLSTSSGSAALDLYSVNWNGSSFDTNTLARLPGIGATNVIVDGEDFQSARVQTNFNQGTSAVLGAFTYDQIAQRLEDIVRVMGGRLTSIVSTQTLKPMAFGGAVGTPGLILTNGTTYDTTSGLYRPTTNELGVSIQGVEATRFSTSVASQPQQLQRAGTSLASPPYTWSGDLDSGFGYVASDQHRAIAGGVEVQQWRTVGGVPKALFPLGVVGNPIVSFIGDENTGVFSPGADRFALVTNGVAGLELNANQQRISATQGRCSASQSGTQNLANNTVTNVLFNTEQFDVGGYHDTVTNTDRFTVPTGFGGLHSAGGYVTFNESSAAVPGIANTGQRGVQVTVNGAVVGEVLVDAAAAGDTKLAVPPVLVDLVATDIVRVTAFQTCGGTMNITASRGWVLHED